MRRRTLSSLSWRQRLVLAAAANVEYLVPRFTNNLPHGVYRSLVNEGMLEPHKSGGYAATDEGRALAENLNFMREAAE